MRRECLKAIATLAWALVFMFYAGCERRAASAKSADSPARPAVFRIGYTPTEETAVDREGATRLLSSYLSRILGIKVELVRTASYGPAIEALASGNIDLIDLGPFAYVLAEKRGAAEAIVVPGQEAKGPRMYQSALITGKHTGLQNLKDVTTQAARIKFNYTDPASNSGHLVPMAKLATLGLRPEQDFKSMDYTLSHSVAVLNVALGKADLAGVSNTTLQSLLHKGRIAPDAINVLWISEPLPNGPLAIRAALPEAFKQEVKTALLNLIKQEPELSRKIMAQYRDANLIYVKCEQGLYDEIRALSDQNKVRIPADSDNKQRL